MYKTYWVVMKKINAIKGKSKFYFYQMCEYTKPKDIVMLRGKYAILLCFFDSQTEAQRHCYKELKWNTKAYKKLINKEFRNNKRR